MSLISPSELHFQNSCSADMLSGKLKMWIQLFYISFQLHFRTQHPTQLSLKVSDWIISDWEQWSDDAVGVDVMVFTLHSWMEQSIQYGELFSNSILFFANVSSQSSENENLGISLSISNSYDITVWFELSWITLGNVKELLQVPSTPLQWPTLLFFCRWRRSCFWFGVSANLTTRETEAL